MRQFLKGRLRFLWEQILSFENRLLLLRYSSSMEGNRESERWSFNRNGGKTLGCHSSREEGVFDDNLSSNSSKPFVVTPHLNRLDETVQMRGHNMWYYAELMKIIPNYHQILLLSRALGVPVHLMILFKLFFCIICRIFNVIIK